MDRNKKHIFLKMQNSMSTDQGRKTGQKCVKNELTGHEKR